MTQHLLCCHFEFEHIARHNLTNHGQRCPSPQRTCGWAEAGKRESITKWLMRLRLRTRSTWMAGRAPALPSGSQGAGPSSESVNAPRVSVHFQSHCL
jgi:hypothetical protein